MISGLVILFSSYLGIISYLGNTYSEGLQVLEKLLGTDGP